MDQLIIIGAGGHGKVLADIAEKMNTYSRISFLDDGELRTCIGYPVIGKVCDAKLYTEDCEFFVAIGNAEVRSRIMADLTAMGAKIATLVHPAAVIGADVTVGEGTAIMAGAVINSSVSIGRGCIINTSSSVDHDCVIGDYVHVSVGAHVCGVVRIGDKSWIGAGAVVRNTLSICEGCMIGIGAAVVKDITEQGTYVGVPAKKR